jgi:hypothetical protein
VPRFPIALPLPPAPARLAPLLLATTTGLGVLAPAAGHARQADPIPPAAPPISDAVALTAVPEELRLQTGLQLVLDRSRRQLMLLENGELRRRFPAAVGMVGWETPAGRFQVMEKQVDPVWEHPQNGKRVGPGPANPLGSRWIGFHRDCSGRKGWDGERYLDVQGCVVAGFHGTPHRWTVGRAISHGCVRLYDEHVRDLFELVQVGTPVTVLP